MKKDRFSQLFKDIRTLDIVYNEFTVDPIDKLKPYIGHVMCFYITSKNDLTDISLAWMGRLDNLYAENKTADLSDAIDLISSNYPILKSSFLNFEEKVNYSIGTLCCIPDLALNAYYQMRLMEFQQ